MQMAGDRVSALALATAVVSLCMSAIGTVAFTLAVVYHFHVPLLYRDEWFTVLDFRRFAEGHYGLGDLARQHNEHRLLFPRLVFFTDELLFSLSGLLNATVTVVLQAVNAVILIALMMGLVARPAYRVMLAGFILVMLFTLRQEQNFTNGFQLQFVGVFTAASLAGLAYVAALDRLRDGRGRSTPYFALSALGCLVATYTMANGVLAGGVLTAAGVLRRAPWPVTAATAALSAALATMFFHNYEPGSFSWPISYAVVHPLPYLRYVFSYIGNPIGSRSWTEEALGTVGVTLAACAAWRMWRGMAQDSASLNLSILMGFILASAGATAYGRIALGADQAIDSRYTTPSLLFWCAVVVFWFPVAVASRPRWASLAALTTLMAVLTGFALLAELAVWPSLARRATALRRVSDSLISGLYDSEAAGVYEHISQDEIAPLVPFLREHRLAAFADPDVAALGRPLSVLSGTAPLDDCEGSVEARADATLGADGVRLTGTARDEETQPAPHRIVVTNRDGTIIGFGSASLPSLPPRLWSAYAKAQSGDVLQAYARLTDASFCKLGTVTVAFPAT